MARSGGGRIIGIPRRLLRPLTELAGLVRKYGSIPRAIAAIISTYIVESVFGFGSYAVASILVVYDYVTGSLAWVRVFLGGSFGSVGVDILGALRWLQIELTKAVMAAGPLGPVIAIGIAAVTLALLYRAAVAVLGELPVGSSLVDFLGLR